MGNEGKKNCLDSNLNVPFKGCAICTYYIGEKISTICIDLLPEERITVVFEKGYVIMRTQVETKFVCKGNSFVSLWSLWR